jgi:hypothetical protein
MQILGQLEEQHGEIAGNQIQVFEKRELYYKKTGGFCPSFRPRNTFCNKNQSQVIGMHLWNKKLTPVNISR